MMEITEHQTKYFTVKTANSLHSNHHVEGDQAEGSKAFVGGGSAQFHFAQCNIREIL